MEFLKIGAGCGRTNTGVRHQSGQALQRDHDPVFDAQGQTLGTPSVTERVSG